VSPGNGEGYSKKLAWNIIGPSKALAIGESLYIGPISYSLNGRRRYLIPPPASILA